MDNCNLLVIKKYTPNLGIRLLWLRPSTKTIIQQLLPKSKLSSYIYKKKSIIKFKLNLKSIFTKEIEQRYLIWWKVTFLSNFIWKTNEQNHSMINWYLSFISKTRIYVQPDNKQANSTYISRVKSYKAIIFTSVSITNGHYQTSDGKYVQYTTVIKTNQEQSYSVFSVINK